MSSRGLALALALLLAGCGRQAGPSQTTTPALPRRLTTSGLVITCAHVVVGPELIRGVLTAQNNGTEPLSIVDRWNSWGAYQWTLSIDGQSAGNPQMAWDENGYSETVLRPGETRHARFYITRRRDASPPGVGSWCFLVGEPPIIIKADSGKAPKLAGPFAAGQEVILTMDGAASESSGSNSPSSEVLWRGKASVRSIELNALEDLEPLAKGKPLG
jgi:hypothetical protein